ncbi:MAG: hypothetical protein CSB24_05725 [Deltaproteobacteria bacterium]|nr:MAG: hypothetical protein CSB24_05725 [Deltaproteobacteria bacterium]
MNQNFLLFSKIYHHRYKNNQSLKQMQMPNEERLDVDNKHNLRNTMLQLFSLAFIQYFWGKWLKFNFCSDIFPVIFSCNDKLLWLDKDELEE